MKFRRLEIEGFRGFGMRQELDLDADTIIVVGANGSGKTSIFDAILWALTGALPRVEDIGGSVISEYAASGEARVALAMGGTGDEDMLVVRSRGTGESGARLQLEVGGDRLRGAEAEVQLLRRLWPEALSASKAATAFSTALTRSVYLQQDLVRQFVEAATDQDRFEAVSELVGVGRVRDLQTQLESGRKAWTQATNKEERETQARRVRLQDLEGQLAKLAGDNADEAALWQRWRDWWAELVPAAPGIPDSSELSDRAEASRALDGALRMLSAELRSNDRKSAEAQSLIAELAEKPAGTEAAPSGLGQELAEARSLLTAAQGELEEARARTAARQEAAIRDQERAAQLAVLAELALQHLDERCPVCTQKYDRDVAVANLEALRKAATPSDDVPPEKHLDALVDAVSRAETQARDLEAKEASGLAMEETRRMAVARRAARLADLEVEPDPTTSRLQLEQVITACTSRDAMLTRLQKAGEQLALELARSSEAIRRNELLREHEAVALVVSRETEEIVERRAAGDVAAQILDHLRDAAATLVDAQLRHVEPLLQRVYARIEPHPAFRAVELVSSFQRGRGRLYAQVADELVGVKSHLPGTVLSSSQLNALAVSVFLALNLGVPAVPVSSAVLDDPLQSLDDVNLLGLVDLLRRTRQQRQLLISTHDARFAGLLERKLRPIGEGRTLITRLSGWRRNGPEVLQTEVTPEHQRLKLVA